MTDNYYTGSVKCRDKLLAFGKETVCMGILNVTPDSFSDGGRNYKFSDAMMNVKAMIEDGAQVIDVGGESTRPGYTEISVDEELSRIVPVVEAIRDNFDVVISIDTYKSKVAEGALEAGCHIINDIYGFMYDPNMASVVKKFDAAAILMFNCRRNGECIKEDIIDRAVRELDGSIRRAHEAGIEDNRLILDPGVGFGTSRAQDIELTRRINELSFGGKYPMLIACSRKRTPSVLLPRETTPDQRDPVSIGMALAGVACGASMVRVHNVRDTFDALCGFDKTIREE